MAGLVAGPVALLAILLAPQPASVSPQAWADVAVGLLRVIWWMTEAVPLATTALLSVLLFPMLDVMDTAVCIGVAVRQTLTKNGPVFRRQSN
jgi:sodium-dependent dicarboxylate transporter 2/3/5